MTPPQTLPDGLLDAATGFMAAQSLFAAAELGVFAALSDGPRSLGDLASGLGLDAARLAVVVDATTTLGVLECREGQYRIDADHLPFLSGGESDLAPLFRFWGRMTYPLWMRLPSAVRSGTGASWTALSGEQQRIYSDGVEALGRVHARALAQLYDFSRHRRVLDLGGGTGAWLAAILERHPHVTGTMIDFPNAAAIARGRLAVHLASGRADVVDGDLFTVPIPEGHDVFLLANVVHGFSAERNEQLLRRLRGGASAGATLLMADFWTDATHQSPRLAALIAGSFLLTTGEGRVYSVDDARAWLASTGWRFTQWLSLPNAGSAVVSEAV